MTRLVSLFPLLAIVASVLTGCGGGHSSNSIPNAALGRNGNVPAPSNVQPAPQPAPLQPPAPQPAPPNSQPSAPAQSSALPTPPGDATVFDQVQNTTDNWNSCSICAGGTNDTDNFWTAPHESSPSMSGSSREFYVGGPKWSNALFWKSYHERPDATHFLWEFYVFWDPTSMANIWSAEFDFWQLLDGKQFMIGSQCNFGDGFWDIWDNHGNQWLHSDIECHRMDPNQWHHIQWYMERLGADHYRYDTLVVDGQAFNVNRTFDPQPVPWDNAMGVQWQLDQSSTGVDIHEWVDNVKLTVW